MDVAATILSDDFSSRLQKALVYDKPLASDVAAFQISLEISGVFVVQATARPGASLDDIQSVIATEISRLAKLGPTTRELNRAKTKREYNFITGLNASAASAGRRICSTNTTRILGARSSSGTSSAIARWTRRRSNQPPRAGLTRTIASCSGSIPKHRLRPRSRDRSQQEPDAAQTGLQDAGRPDGEAR